MKEFFKRIKGIAESPWTIAIFVAAIVSGFAVWYGAWWSLFIALPVIYEIGRAHV